MGKLKHILGMLTILENPSYGNRCLTLKFFRLMPRRKVFGIQTYELGFNHRDAMLTITVQCRMETEDVWFGHRATMEFKDTRDIADLRYAACQLMGDHHDTTDSTKLLENIAEKCLHVDYDARLSEYVAVSSAEDLRYVRAWHDTGKKDGGCSVIAHTRYSSPAQPQIQEAIKREMCQQGYADSLVDWVNRGMPFSECAYTQRPEDKVHGIPIKFFLDYPQTHIEPAIAYAKALSDLEEGAA